MKLRKHLKNKRLERFVQLELDRIIDLQFGMGEAAYHVIVELYDRGNIILTDHEMTILNILRPHVEGEEEVRFAVREKYPESRAKEQATPRSLNALRTIVERGQPGDTLKKILNPVLGYGPAIIDHILTKHQLANVRLEPVADIVIEEEVILEPEEKSVAPPAPTKANNKKGGGKQAKQKQAAKAPKKEDNANIRYFDYDRDLPTLLEAIEDAEQILIDAQTRPSKGYIIQKREARPTAGSGGGIDDFILLNQEYHPYLFAQHAQQLYKEFATFDAAVDEFYSTSESQKIDVKTMQQERDALKKLSNVKRDHEKRLDDLGKWQVFDKNRAELITRNQTLVDNAILAIRSAIASQMPWPDIQNLVKTAQANKDPVASTIKRLKLETNNITMELSDPYAAAANDEVEDEECEQLKPTLIDIDLAMSAYANATRYYDKKRMAAKKQQRTIESSTKAYKSAERKTQQSLKEMRNISTISKARKVFWFEKFYWFISSENYLIIGGRDQQQNELIVKRYMRPTDIYVHAEIQGASSVVIRNAIGAKDVPPKTLLEAGTMAISYSVAWDAKVVTNAYWVRSNQVSKTAPTGEYLGTGSFMIRGKKNFLPPCHLILGMSFMFKLEESSVERHRGERKVRTFEEEAEAAAAAAAGIDQKLSEVRIENEQLSEVVEEVEIELLDSDDDPDPPKEEAADDDDDEDVDENQFPDTHVKIEHDTGRVTLQSDPTLVQRQRDQQSNDGDLIFMGDNQPFIIHTGQQSKVKQQKRDRDQRKGKKPQPTAVAADEKTDENEKKSNQPKRGQKGKLKKIREKYKDQDEEEKRIRMDILKSAGSGKGAVAAKNETMIKLETVEGEDKPKKPEFKARERPPAAAAADEEQDDVADDAPTTGDIEMLDALTGCPMDEDELLFAVPVIAPYQAMQNYK